MRWRRQRESQTHRDATVADCLLPLPNEDVVDHGAAAEDDSHADQDTGHRRRRRVEVAECVEDEAGEEHRNRDEEAADGTGATGARLGQVLVVAPLERRRPQLHGEQELDGADEQAAQVQGEREGAQGQGDVVHHDKVLAVGHRPR